jgi:hypothetical protein
LVYIKPMLGGTGLYKREVEEVAVVGHIHSGLDLQVDSRGRQAPRYKYA